MLYRGLSDFCFHGLTDTAKAGKPRVRHLLVPVMSLLKVRSLTIRCQASTLVAFGPTSMRLQYEHCVLMVGMLLRWRVSFSSWSRSPLLWP